MIYVVMGQAGEYSERREWPVVAFEEEAAAQRFVEFASAYARDLISEEERRGIYEGCINADPDDFFNYDERGTDLKSPYDPNIRVDGDGVRYFYFPVEVLKDFNIYIYPAVNKKHKIEKKFTLNWKEILDSEWITGMCNIQTARLDHNIFVAIQERRHLEPKPKEFCYSISVTKDDTFAITSSPFYGSVDEAKEQAEFFLKNLDVI